MPSAFSTPTLPFLERLLDGEKVEWKTLGEVCDRTKGTKITATQMKAMHKSNAPVKIFAGGQTFALVDYNDLPQSDIYFFPSIIVKSRGIIEFEYYDKPFSHKSEMWSYHTNSPDVNAKFLYYYLKTREDYFQQLGSVMQMPQISIPTTEKFPIPLPPLRVQARIVEILDKFTQLEAELEAELEARNKQYDFYRNRLLDFALRDDLVGQVEWKTLGEICENLDSQRRPITSSKRKKGIYPYYGASGIVDFVESYIYEGDYLLVSEDGANLLARNTPIAFSISGKNWVNNHAHVLKFDTYEGRKFVEYYLNQIDLKPYISGAAQPKLNQNNLNSIPIPLPPLSEQRRIVEILDRFDTLTHSISEGLPREIALRRKQYEYYRDALLRFPPPAPTA